MGRHSVTRVDPRIIDETNAAAGTNTGRPDDDRTLAREALAERFLSVLSAPQREAVELRLTGLSYEACARELGISIRSVRVRLDRAFARMHALAEDPEFALPD